MPVSDDQALKLAEIEVMRSIQRAIDANSRQVETLTNQVIEQGKIIHQIDARLIRTETKNEQIIELKAEVGTLKAKTDQLESERDRRRGAIGLVEWFGRNWLILVVIFFVAALMLRAGGKLPL